MHAAKDKEVQWIAMRSKLLRLDWGCGTGGAAYRPTVSGLTVHLAPCPNSCLQRHFSIKPQILTNFFNGGLLDIAGRDAFASAA